MTKTPAPEQADEGLLVGEAVPKTTRIPPGLREVWEEQEDALNLVKASSAPDAVFMTADGRLVVFEVKRKMAAAKEASARRVHSRKG
jgi:hypothetical protein